MTLREEIRSGFLGVGTGRVPLYCLQRLLPPEADQRRALHDIGWAALGENPGFSVRLEGCTESWKGVLVGELLCRKRMIETPAGLLTSMDAMTALNCRAPLEYLFKSERDYPALMAMIRAIRYLPEHVGFRKADVLLGDDGLVCSWLGFDPMHEIMLRMMGVQNFCYQWADNRQRVLELYSALLERHRRLFRLAAEGPAELILYGGNFHPSVVSHAQFEQYYLPVYRELGRRLRARGKRLGARLNAATGLLRGQFARCPWDFLEGWAAAPGGDMTVSDARRAWRGRALSVGFPSTLHHASADAIREAVRTFIRENGSAPGLLIGLTEDFPEGSAQKLFTSIAEAAR